MLRGSKILLIATEIRYYKEVMNKIYFCRYAFEDMI